MGGAGVVEPLPPMYSDDPLGSVSLMVVVAGVVVVLPLLPGRRAALEPRELDSDSEFRCFLVLVMPFSRLLERSGF